MSSAHILTRVCVSKIYFYSRLKNDFIFVKWCLVSIWAWYTICNGMCNSTFQIRLIKYLNCLNWHEISFVEAFTCSRTVPLTTFEVIPTILKCKCSPQAANTYFIKIVLVTPGNCGIYYGHSYVPNLTPLIMYAGWSGFVQIHRNGWWGNSWLSQQLNFELPHHCGCRWPGT